MFHISQGLLQRVRDWRGGGGGGGHALNTCIKFNLPLSINIILVLLPD